jgi:DNA-binding response OmpR family regulator
MRELEGPGRAAHPPVIAVSGLGSEASRERTRGAGFAGHIKKPFDEAAVVAAIGAALSHLAAQDGSSRASTPPLSSVNK